MGGGAGSLKRGPAMGFTKEKGSEKGSRRGCQKGVSRKYVERPSESTTPQASL